MRKCLLLVLTVAILLSSFAPAALAQVERNPILDTAFACVEENNIFQRRYNELTGAEVTSLFPLGVPYFFGGQDTEKLMSCYPDYAKRDCYETTRFYRAKKYYVFGFDCSGFCRYVYAQNDLGAIDTLSNMILHKKYYPTSLGGDGSHIYNHHTGMPPYDELYQTLQVGDLLVSKPRARHIMMYIGTLREFGFTTEELGEDLAPYIDYPLVIHCGPNPQYGPRFQEFIDTHPEQYGDCLTTDGGVAVSIVGIPVADAPCQVHDGITDFGYFPMDDGNFWLTVWDLDACTSYCWFRKVGEPT